MAIMLKLFWALFLLSNHQYPAFVFSQLDDEFSFNGGFNGLILGTNISLNGISEIQKNGIIRLTNDTRRLIGRAFYPSPLQFKNSTDGKALSFSTCFAFAIVPEYPKLGGHGLAFTITPTKELGGLPSQYLGLLNGSDLGNSTNHVFAVEFDTVQDFEFGDINDNHVGIDINSLTSNSSAPVQYFADDSTKQDLNLKSGKTIQAWVDYDSVRNLLNVSLSLYSSKPRFPILSFPIDLSPILENTMYVGFSSSTGLLASSHYILGWNLKMNGAAQSLDLSSLPSLPGPKKKKHTALTTIGVSVSSVLFIIIIAFSLSIYLFIKFKNPDVIEDWELNLGPHRFSYQELKLATKGFREKQVVGFGGFGRVYKGTLPSSKIQVAVKRVSHESKQGLREFVSEIGTIGRLRHRNLVQLQGWCRRRGDLLLVYDFMPNGSLDKFIFDDDDDDDDDEQQQQQPNKMILSWEQRFKIIKGVAAALLYLHEQWEQIVVHRDVKASNVLLDGEFNGRLGDFGLARLYEHGSNPSTTRVVGTLGYLAPELTRTGKATPSTDVFAFGALLLETTCGRRPIEAKAATPEELILVDWIWDKWLEGRVFDVVDRRLYGGDYDEGEVAMVLKLGLMCSNCSPGVRPTMRQVVSYLEGEVKVPQVLSAPGEYETGKSEVGFDDFVHSYPFSFEKASVPHSFKDEVDEEGDDGTDGDVEEGGGATTPTSSVCLLSGTNDR